MNNEEVKKMAEDHWSYVKSVIDVHDKAGQMNETERRMAEAAFKLCEFHYITAFIHGCKHGMEERREEARMERLEEQVTCRAVKPRPLDDSGNRVTSNDRSDPLSYFRGDAVDLRD